MADHIEDTVPVDPGAELSLDNVLTDIRFRGQLGYKLTDYSYSADSLSVELEFEKCTGAAEKPRKP